MNLNYAVANVNATKNQPKQENLEMADKMAEDILNRFNLHEQNEMILSIICTVKDNRNKEIEKYAAKIDEFQASLKNLDAIMSGNMF